MNQRQFYPIALLIALLLLVAGISAAPATAEPVQDTYSYLPIVADPLVIVERYDTGFDAGIEPWTAVRWRKGTEYEVKHDDGCNDSRCGFLYLPVSNRESYVIASPQIAGPGRSYHITFRAKLSNRKDKHQYGAVFSADAGSPDCPGDNKDSCFNRYYEFLVRYRNEGGEYLEYRIRRIDEHDDSNVAYGEVLSDWTRAEGVKVNEWIKWEVRFRNSGHIYIKANNREQPAYGRDNKFTNQRYFGLITRSNTNTNAYVLFDKFEIVKED